MLPPTILLLFIFVVTRLSLVVQAVIWTPFDPVSLPLAVKSPYLNVWLPRGDDTKNSISNSWPYHWPSTESVNVRGWKGILVVDTETYWIMGVGTESSVAKIANVTSVAFTASRTSFNLTAGSVNVQLEFLSPIEVTDLTRLSLPFSYIYVTVASSDGEPHDVRMGMAVTAEMISGNHSSAANASSIVSDDVVALQMQLQTPGPFDEIHDVPEDATAYIATINSPNVTYQVSSSDGVPNSMNNVTSLPDTVDSNYSSHALNSPYDNYGIMVNMGNVNEPSSPVVFALGIVRDPSISFASLSGETQLRHPYFSANFSNPSDLISFVLNDFNRSLDSAQTFDTNLMTAGRNVSSTYADLLSLTTRQSLSGLDVTISQSVDGSFNLSDVQIYVKDMGGIGSGGVNAASVLYSALPMYRYLAPDLLAHLLRPLFVAQDDPLYTQPYAAQHLGVAYPNATAQNVAHNFGIEESANMIILSLAHAQATNDHSLISNFYDLLGGWTKYLIANSLAPGTQQTSPLDGILVPNQTNLALKGVIGISAMGTISTLLGQTQDAKTYNSTASSYIQEWLSLSRSTDGTHILTTYGDETSTGLLYNLFADQILGLNLVPVSVYQNQSNLYRSLQDNGMKGVPLASSNAALSRTDWTMFAAATSMDNATRDAFVSGLHQVASTSTNNTPLGVVFDPSSGVITSGTNSPAHGSMYALLALSGTTVNSLTASSSTTSPPSHHDAKFPVAPVVCGVIGGVLALLIAFIAIFLKLRRRETVKQTQSVFPFRIPQMNQSWGSSSATIPRFYASRGDVKQADGQLASVSISEPVAVISRPKGNRVVASTSTEDERVSRQTEVVSGEDQSLGAEGRARRLGVDDSMLEMELRTLRTQVDRLLERRQREEEESGVSSELENPPSYDSP